jgi:hypothetical protein
MSFSVVIDSVNKIEGNVYNSKFAIDWSFMPEGEYDLTFSLQTSPRSGDATDVKAIALDGLGTQLQVYLAGQTTSAKSCNVIGLLERVIFNDGFAFTQSFHEHNYTPPVVLKQRPSNNFFNVRLVNNVNGTANAGFPPSYILILHFNKRK